MRALAAAALLLGLSACEPSDLPAPYRHLEIPGGLLGDVAARQRGATLFLQHCAICHGEKADGHGRRQNLSSRPADLTDPSWRARVTPRRVYYVIREGVHGTAMPAWKVLSPEQTWDLVAFVLSAAQAASPAPLASGAATPEPSPPTPGPARR